MQGFNRYYPPDFDPQKHVTLNTYHGKHALGDRARKIDKGILITRFELPFNIWCGTCNNHIGMGVRYNAEKKKVGNYFSTPIYSFRCKCHLCSGWFEVQTDPKNTAYVVTSGARKQESDWDPEENGGFPVHDSNAASAPPGDAIASLEKTTAAEENLNTVVRPRISQLASLSERRNADPYALSRTLRNSFRVTKKADKRAREEEAAVRDKFALPAELALVKEDEVREEAKELWEKAKGERRWDEDDQGKGKGRADVGPSSVASLRQSSSKTPSSTSRARIRPSSSNASKPSVKSALASTLLKNTQKRADPFASAFSSSSTPSSRATKGLGISRGS